MTLTSVHKTAVIFDIGGVLIDWNPRYLYRKFFNDDDAAVESFFSEIGFFEWNHHQDRGRPMPEAVEVLSRQFPQYAHLIRAYDERYEETLGGAIQPSVDILQRLAKAGYALYGLSNWPAELFSRVRPRFPFLDWFEDIVVSGEVMLSKPDPRIFAVLLERIGQRAEECLFIDDSQSNIAAAEQLGFRTIRFESSDQLKQVLSQRGFFAH